MLGINQPIMRTGRFNQPIGRNLHIIIEMREEKVIESCKIVLAFLDDADCSECSERLESILCELEERLRG